MLQNIKLIIVGFLQLLFLSANTFFIAHKDYDMIFISCLLTNIIFSYAVKSLAFSSWWNRISYAVGASFGCLAGTWIAALIFH